MPIPAARTDYPEIRDAVRALVRGFGDAYFREKDEAREYPEEFVETLTKEGWMAALIPEEFGGAGLGLTEASIIMEEINRAGGNSGACHGQMYNMNTLLRHGSAEQKAKFLPEIASGALRRQSLAVTEPTAGTNTTDLRFDENVTVSGSGRIDLNSGDMLWFKRSTKNLGDPRTPEVFYQSWANKALKPFFPR